MACQLIVQLRNLIGGGAATDVYAGRFEAEPSMRDVPAYVPVKWGQNPLPHL